MSEVSDYLEASGAMAKTANVAALDDDPEQAARSLELEEASGVPATAIFGDVDTFERQHKAAMGSSIIADNVHIADYLNSHPMAPRLSHDDLGQLDTASQAITNTGGESRLAKWLKDDSISQSFMKGFGDQPIDTRRFYQGFVSQHDIDWALHTTRLQAATAGAAAQVVGLGEIGMEGLSRVTGGLLHMGFDGMSAIFGESAARDLTAMAELAMMRGDIGVKSAGGGASGPLARMEQNSKLFKDLHSALQIADHFPEGEPPPGVHPLIDTAKAEQAKADGKTLKDALSESAKSATRDRSPDYYSNFVRQHVGDREIGIDAEAVRALYGDKLPEVGDNILGWVPDLAGKLAAAEGIGGDIRVPLADYFARVDPDVAKELHDHLRLRDGGLTLDELKIGKERAEAPAPVKEPEVPKAPSEDYPEEWFQDKSWQTDELLPLEGDAATYVNDPTVFQAPNGRLVKVNPETGERLKTSFSGAGQGNRAGVGGEVVQDRAPFKVTSVQDAEAAVKHLGKEGLGKSRADAIKAAGYGQKEVIADPLQLVRGAGGLEPQFSLGDRKVTLQRMGEQETKGPFGKEAGFHDFDLLDETGKKIGFMNLSEAKGGKQIYVEMIQAGKTDKMYDPNFLGPGIIRDLKRQIRAEFPQAETITGHRVSGAREKAGVEMTAPMPVIKLSQEAPEGWGHVDAGPTLRELFAEIGGQTIETKLAGELHYLPELEPYRAELDTAIRSEIARIAGKNVQVFTPDQISVTGGRGLLVRRGFHQQFREQNPWLVVALDSPNAMGVARHEAVHHLRQQWFFTEGEWSTLERASRQNDWKTLYGIERRYEDESEGVKLEESIAEAYRTWKDAIDKKAYPPGINAIFQKLQDFFEALRLRVKEITGKDLSWDEIFQKVDTGEVGGREGNAPLKKGAFRPQAMDEPIEGIFEKAKAMGVTQAHMDRMLNLIAKRNAEDLTKATARAEKQQKRSQTAEWKQRRTDLRDEVREQLASRPDLATDQLFAKGGIKLHPDFLSEEQKASLPKDYIQKKDGVNPDDLAPYFGYTSGDALVERLGMLTSDRKSAGMSQRDYFNRLVDVETDRRLNAEFGDLGQNIMDAAKDQALSETQLNIVHEETMAYAMAAKQVPKFTQEQVREQVRQAFETVPVGQISSDRIIQTAGKLGRKIEEASSKGDWEEAYRISQQRNHAVIAAKMARDYERQQVQLDRTAKTMGKREVLSIEGEYRHHIQDVLTRIGYKTARSIANIQENIQRQTEQTLPEFLQAKLVESMGYRDMPLADVLQDPAFKKNIKDLTYVEFKQVKGTIDGLVHNGRDERKINREGEAYDRMQTVEEMKEQVRTFSKRAIPAGYEPGLAKQYIAGTTAIPTLMNRFDRGDPRGLFHKFIVYPLTRASDSAARLSREISKPYRALGDFGDMKKLVDSPLDPNIWRYSTFTHENVLGLLQNAGNKSNWNVAARGWGADPEALMKWLHANTTKEHWDRAQKMGDTIWKDLVGKADREYERLNGQTIDKIPLEPIDTPFGQYKGWYHKLIPDPVWYSEKMKMRGGAYNDADFGHILTSNGYTRARTGAIYPVDLSFAQVPKHIQQMIHDISFRGPLLEVQKILKDPSLHNVITQHYGKEYAKLLVPYLEDIAGKQSINGAVWAKMGEASETLRQNTIGTYIGGNPFTVMKHAPTAFFMSAGDVGPVRLMQSYKKLFGQSPEIGKTWWNYAVEQSETLQRRERNWQETLGGALKEQYGYPTMREKVMQWGAWPVAMSDKLSAVPLWIARFEKSLEEGSSHGEAVDIANRSVTRQHGSTDITNQPELVRGGGPLHGWLTSVYGFFGTVMQRRIELMHSMNDIYQLGKEREIKAAAARTPGLFMDFLTYVVIPTYIEEKVTGMTTNDQRGYGEHLAMASARGVASSFLYLRDLVDAFATGHTPGVGLLSSVATDLDKSVRDVFKGKAALNREHAGKTVGDFLTTFGELTGKMPKVVANAARFGVDYARGQTHPRTAGEVFRGVTRGTTKLRVEK